jgi:hypothetical protein
MLWIKSLHLIFMVTWFAGLFYLPRLFVYHAATTDRISLERFKLMERRLFWGIMTPGAVHHRLRAVAVARLVPARHRLAARQDRAGRAPRRLSPLVLAPAARLRRGAQHEKRALVPLVQRVPDDRAVRHGAPGCLQALLAISSPPRRGAWNRFCRKKFPPWEE